MFERRNSRMSNGKLNSPSFSADEEWEFVEIISTTTIFCTNEIICCCKWNCNYRNWNWVDFLARN
jgi:hypothetical protein